MHIATSKRTLIEAIPRYLEPYLSIDYLSPDTALYACTVPNHITLLIGISCHLRAFLFQKSKYASATPYAELRTAVTTTRNMYTVLLDVIGCWMTCFKSSEILILGDIINTRLPLHVPIFPQRQSNAMLVHAPPYASKPQFYQFPPLALEHL